MNALAAQIQILPAQCQVYTQNFEQRFFFEVVERRHYAGYGAANAAVRLAAQARQFIE